MKPLNVGDRVAVYAGRARYVGVIKSPAGTLGESADTYLVSTKDGVAPSVFHRKQLRKLVPKKRREIWVNEYEGAGFSVPFRTKFDAEAGRILSSEISLGKYIRTIRFVEAKEQK